MLEKRIIYADHSATTKVRSEVVDIMDKIMKEDFGNPSSIHTFGKTARKHLEEARKNIADVIGAKEEEIFFTSGGTESDNTVIFGIAKLVEEGLLQKEKHIISTSIEHPAIKEPLELLCKKGWKISWLKVDKEGFVNPEELELMITPRTSLVSVIHANNEIGTIQDLKKISEIIRKNNVLFHTDAVQSFCKIPIDVKDIGIDFMSMSSHKIYGPKGVGGLYVKSGNTLIPHLVGGGQEGNLRPGTENLPGIVGFGLAAKLLHGELHQNTNMLQRLQIKLMEKLSVLGSKIIFTGPSIDKYPYRLPGHVSICTSNIQGESLVLQADLKGIAVSSASACKNSKNRKNASIEPSHVLIACTIPQEYIKGSLRITLGKENTMEDINYISESIKEIVMKISKKMTTVKL